MDFHFKVYKTQGENMVAACDESVYGRKFEDGRRILHVDRNFYGKELIGWERLEELLAQATIANLVGEELVSRATKAGFIEPAGVLRIKGVPHAQMVKI